MGSRFEKFSGRARRVLSLAQEQAQRFNHNYIGTEHILLGLVLETEGVAAGVLSSLSVDLNKVRSGVEFIIGRGEKPAQGEIGLTTSAKKVVELAVDEFRRMNHTYIGTEHLLIGLLREGEGVAAGVLESLDVTLDKVRAETHRILSHTSGTGSQSSRGTSSKNPILNERSGVLNLSAAGLTELPPGVCDLTWLSELHLNGNHLTELPPEIGNLTNLRELHLNGNQLTELPPEIGNLTNLRELHLNGNQLTSLPPEISGLTNLIGLDLRDNQLTVLTREMMELMDRGIGSFSGNPYNG